MRAHASPPVARWTGGEGDGAPPASIASPRYLRVSCSFEQAEAAFVALRHDVIDSTTATGF